MSKPSKAELDVDQESAGQQDAALIAAASDLLAALEMCEREMSDVYRAGLVDSLTPPPEASTFTQALCSYRRSIQSRS